MARDDIYSELHDPLEPTVPEEYPSAKEFAPLGDEYNDWQTVKDPKVKRNRKGFTLYLKLFAAVTVALTVNTSFYKDLLGSYDVFGDGSGDYAVTGEDHYHEHEHYHDDLPDNPDEDLPDESHDDPAVDPFEAADGAFPDLPNPMPDTYLGQAFLRFESSGGMDWLYAGAAYGLSGGDYADIDGVYYDSEANVLTLENLDAPTLVLNANMMGNSFAVNLVGENRLANVLVWGYYYGGSITFTGSGSLTVNEDGDYDYGILLRSEESESCIMADRGVTLDVSGSTGAILVNASTAEKGLYYLSPLTLSGGIRSGVRFLDNDGNETDVQNHTVNDTDGNPVKHIIIR